ncbi:HAD domain-containing protein [Leifsonia sp. Leaf264]|uniref:HAD domain-containing protein n=1 Tax=Leifsonia sp. Leaf264 TaxID=1736314 RepID=UPI0006FC0151|nr:HAD domain-containing protein [Leifsonia sp. Leaf264]KQO98116.1 hypothetical protein ASF30_08450 [Leifsonia sp. Leaf264]
MRPRLYLDFDGCINAPLAFALWDEKAVAYAGTTQAVFKIQWAPDMVRALDKIITEFDVELVWVTTWCEDDSILTGVVPNLNANEDLPGISSGRVMPYVDGGWDGAGWWKRDGIIADQVASPAPFIWVDDFEVAPHGPFVLQAVGTTPSLLVEPQFDFGLKPAHLTQIREFLEGLPAES